MVLGKGQVTDDCICDKCNCPYKGKLTETGVCFDCSQGRQKRNRLLALTKKLSVYALSLRPNRGGG